MSLAPAYIASFKSDCTSLSHVGGVVRDINRCP